MKRKVLDLVDDAEYGEGEESAMEKLLLMGFEPERIEEALKVGDENDLPSLVEHLTADQAGNRISDGDNNNNEEVEYGYSHAEIKSFLQGKVFQTIRPTDADFDLMEQVVKSHPKYPQWKNKIIEYFQVGRSVKIKALVLKVKMANMRQVRAVSWVMCSKDFRAKERRKKLRQEKKLKAKKKKRKTATAAEKASQHKKELVGAMRVAIKPQIHNFRYLSHGVRSCKLCGSMDANDLQVDHHPKKFRHLTDDFLGCCEAEDIEIPQEFAYIPHGGRYTFINRKKDKAFREKWEMYHSNVAGLRFLCKKCNMAEH